MEEKISVEKAIEIGKKRVYRPTYIFLFTSFFITFSLTTNLISEKPTLSVEFIPIGFILSLIITVLVGNKLMSKWKLWAFKNVYNVNELLKRAVQERLLYLNSPFMEKIEFRSQKEILEWNKIMLKFTNENILTENIQIPESIKIYYSIRKNLYKSTLYISFSLLFIFIGIDERFPIIIIILILGLLSLSIPYLIKLINRRPQLIIDKNGIMDNKNNLMKWENIKDEQIIADSTNSELFFIFNEQEKYIDIKNLNIKKLHLKEVLETFRIRNKKTAANSYNEFGQLA